MILKKGLNYKKAMSLTEDHISYYMLKHYNNLIIKLQLNNLFDYINQFLLVNNQSPIQQ